MSEPNRPTIQILFDGVCNDNDGPLKSADDLGKLNAAAADLIERLHTTHRVVLVTSRDPGRVLDFLEATANSVDRVQPGIEIGAPLIGGACLVPWSGTIPEVLDRVVGHGERPVKKPSKR